MATTRAPDHIDPFGEPKITYTYAKKRAWLPTKIGDDWQWLTLYYDVTSHVRFSHINKGKPSPKFVCKMSEEDAMRIAMNY